MLIETIMLVSLGIAVPENCTGDLFRMRGQVICVERSTRGNKAIVPRRESRTVYEVNRNRGYTKQRNIIKKPKPFGVSRYTRRSKRSIVRNAEHVLYSRDLDAENDRRRAIQAEYSRRRTR